MRHRLARRSGLVLGLGLGLLLTIPRARAGEPTLWEELRREALARPAPPVRLNTVKIRVGPARRPVQLSEIPASGIRSLRLLGNDHAPLKVLMVLAEKTLDEVQEMLSVVRTIARTSPRARGLKLHLICESEAVFRRLDLTQEDFDRHVEFNRYFAASGDDIWLQDWGEIAMVDRAGDPHPRLLILDTNRGVSTLADLPAVLARMWSGYYHIKRTPSGVGDYGGNIEVTPDDVLLLGSTTSPALRQLLFDGGYRDRHAIVRTDWLRVGHIDEILTTLPVPGSPRGHVLLRADPALGLEALAGLSPGAFREELEALVATLYRNVAVHPDGVASEEEARASRRMFALLAAAHARLRGQEPDLEGLVPIDPLDDWDGEARELIRTNRKAARLLDGEIASLGGVAAAPRLATAGERNEHRAGRRTTSAGGATAPLPVVSVPVLYEPSHGAGTIALLPAAPNLIVLGEHLVIPDPLLPSFRRIIDEKVRALGLVPHFIPDASYHHYRGQLHCGTSVFRDPR